MKQVAWSLVAILYVLVAIPVCAVGYFLGMLEMPFGAGLEMGNEVTKAMVTAVRSWRDK